MERTISIGFYVSNGAVNTETLRKLQGLVIEGWSVGQVKIETGEGMPGASVIPSLIVGKESEARQLDRLAFNAMHDAVMDYAERAARIACRELEVGA